MTADAMQDDRERCLDAGMDDYITKPIRPAELADALERATPRPASSDAVRASLDAAALEQLRELGGDDFVVEVIDTFLVDAPDLLSTIRRSLEHGDANELRRAAHTLKSNGATFGADDFAALCRELEERAKNGDVADATELTDRLEREYRSLEAALAALRTGAPFVTAPAGGRVLVVDDCFLRARAGDLRRAVGHEGDGEVDD